MLYIAIQGGVFKILPISKDQNNTWVTINGAKKRDLIDPKLARMAIVVERYKKAVQQSISSKDFSQSDTLLKEIKNYQSEVGFAVMPSQKKVNLEVWYNKYDVFKNLFWQYLLASSLLFILVILHSIATKVVGIVTVCKGCILLGQCQRGGIGTSLGDVGSPGKNFLRNSIKLHGPSFLLIVLNVRASYSKPTQSLGPEG